MSYPTSLPLSQVRFKHGFLAGRVKQVRETVIPRQWEALNDRVPGADRSGCVHNFQVAAQEKAGEFYGLFWQDSDLAKWIEAASYQIEMQPDAALEAELDQLIATIAKAQRPDGYLNTYFQLVEPQNRWANLRDCHELYVAGHMIEAGVAHFRATGKRELLDVVCRLADLIDRTFGLGSDQVPGYCGHEEIELALLKLARATGEPRYRTLASYFIRQRGAAPNYFETESARRGDGPNLPWHMHHDGLATLQAARPVRELTEPVGHAVRMMYLLAAMIDLGAEENDIALQDQSRRLWHAIVHRHLYITGGVGSEPYGEKFCDPFDLPPDRAYSETCAAIGVMMCARRLLEQELRGEYGDVMERALYNNVLAGIALDGKTFFYVNPLEVVPAVAHRRFECHLVKTQRVAWFGCACCPPNIARTLASLAEYVFSRIEGGLAVHLYVGAELRYAVGDQVVRLTIDTDYPWTEEVRIQIETGRAAEFTLALRIPGWCENPQLAVNAVAVSPLGAVDGYVRLRRVWSSGDTIVLSLPMRVERMRADPRVTTTANRVALQRGPVVYCLEEADHGANLAALRLAPSTMLTTRFEPELLGGCVIIEGAGERILSDQALYRATPAERIDVVLRAVPYALWANRGEGEMLVWINEG